MRLRVRRLLQDMGQRMFLALEWLDEEQSAAQEAEAMLMVSLDAAADACHGLLAGTVTVDEAWGVQRALHHAFASLSDAFPRDVAVAGGVLGCRWVPDSADRGAPLLAEGLGSVSPCAMEDVGDGRAVARELIHSSVFFERGSLASRIQRWLLTRPSMDADVSETMRLEAWLNDLPHADPEASLFAAVPEGEVRASALRLHRTFRRGVFSADLINEVLSGNLAKNEFLRSDGTVVLAAIWSEGEPRVVPLTPELDQAIAQIQRGEVPHPHLHGLVMSELVVFLPAE